MWNKKTTLFVIILLITCVAKAENKLTLSAIPDSLKENAYSVVRLYQQEFVYISDISGTLKETQIVTVLNPRGNGSGNFSCSCDIFRSLKKFHGEVYDANGNLVRKIKQSELKYTELFEGLASDDSQFYYEYDPAGYPYTIKYEWEIKYQKGLIGLPPFFPQKAENQSIEKAIYRLYAPESANLIYKAINMPTTPKVINDKDGTYKEWSVNNIKAIEDEPFIESWTNGIPALFIVPQSFSYDGTRGEMTNWNTFGKWQYSLITDRDILPDATKQRITELTKNCKTDKEKVKAIYDYLAQTTRYVSIQLGIGGLQPAFAKDVAKLGFADCKGLSNYTSAMLKEAGITSYYTAISTTNRKLLSDFASANQMNHVILQVPLPNDTLWLECTAPKLPFGYVHNSIAGHDALVITDQGGKLCQLPIYPEEKNKEFNQATIVLNAEGKAEAKITKTSCVLQYERLSEFTELAPSKQVDILREDVYLPEATVSNINFKENKSSEPSITINYNLTCNRFGTQTGNHLFIPINILRKGPTKLSNKKRKFPIYLENGYLDSDTITIEIPSNYTIEAIPSPISINNKFGKLNATISTKENKIFITNNLLMHSGKYTASAYPDFLAFRNEISKLYQSMIVLKKKQ